MSLARNLIYVGKKVVAVGKNYAGHVKEMGGIGGTLDALPPSPVIFLKPTTAYTHHPAPIVLNPEVGEIHHEVELALVIDKLAKDVPEEKALDYVGGYALALDLTARDIQAKAKKAGNPWSIAKGFDGSLPISDVIPKSSIPDPDNVDLWLKVNGETRQSSNTKDMIFNTRFLISYISKIFTLEVGDVILTGTPEGVGPIKAGDVVTCGLGPLKLKYDVKEVKPKKVVVVSKKSKK